MNLLKEQKRIANNEDMVDVNIYLAMEYIAQKEFDRAESLLLETIKDNGSKFAELVLCKMYLYMGRWERAKKYIEQGVKDANVVGNFLFYSDSCRFYR